ncbi:MAG: trypsin-like peptidase domain-containing protein [Myxococcota bacterium]
MPPKLGKPSAAEHARLEARMERIRERAYAWISANGVQTIGLGFKEVRGELTDELCISISVDRKRPRKSLDAPVPRQVKIPGVGSVTTDVVEIGTLRLNSFTGRVRPAMPGVSIGHANVGSGTLGCVVRRRGDPDSLYVLSNSHVLADSGRADIGDPIFQPGPADKPPSPQTRLGKLADFVEFQYSSQGYPNLVDAAIARVRPDQVRSAIRLTGLIPSGIVAASRIKERDRVLRVGRTTNNVFGTVKKTRVKIAKKLPRPGSRYRSRVGFREQVECAMPAADGDSGAAVLSRSGKLMGLHFMGSASHSLFCPISFVFEALGLELV